MRFNVSLVCALVSKELVVQKGWRLPEYTVTQESGPAHRKEFTMTCRVERFVEIGKAYHMSFLQTVILPCCKLLFFKKKVNITTASTSVTQSLALLLKHVSSEMRGQFCLSLTSL